LSTPTKEFYCQQFFSIFRSIHPAPATRTGLGRVLTLTSDDLRFEDDFVHILPFLATDTPQNFPRDLDRDAPCRPFSVPFRTVTTRVARAALLEPHVGPAVFVIVDDVMERADAEFG
jgi:hypothetical protein